MSDALLKWLPFAGAAALFAVGYGLGHGAATAKGREETLTLKVAWEEERRGHADAYGKALADSMEQYRQETERADAIAASYAESKKIHAREAEALQRRIARATNNGSHTFNADFVRLYNAAIGLSGDVLSEALCTPGASGGAGAGAAAGAGRLDPFEGVKEADLLRHLARYGRRCRGLEAQVLGWQALQRSWHERD